MNHHRRSQQKKIDLSRRARLHQSTRRFLNYKILETLMENSGFLFLFFLTVWSLLFAAYQDVFMEHDHPFLFSWIQDKTKTLELNPVNEYPDRNKEFHHFFVLDETGSTNESYFLNPENYAEFSPRCAGIQALIQNEEFNCEGLKERDCREACNQMKQLWKFIKASELALTSDMEEKMPNLDFENFPAKIEVKRVYMAWLINSLYRNFRQSNYEAENFKLKYHLSLFEDFVVPIGPSKTQSEPIVVSDINISQSIDALLRGNTQGEGNRTNFEVLFESLQNQAKSSNNSPVDPIVVFTIISDFHYDNNYFFQAVSRKMKQVTNYSQLYVNLLRLPTTSPYRSEKILDVFRDNIPVNNLNIYSIPEFIPSEDFTDNEIRQNFYSKLNFILAPSLLDDRNKLTFTHEDSELNTSEAFINLPHKYQKKNDNGAGVYYLKLVGTQRGAFVKNYLGWNLVDNKKNELTGTGLFSGRLRTDDQVKLETGNQLDLKLTVFNTEKYSTPDIGLEIYSEDQNHKYHIPIQFKRILPGFVAVLMNAASALALLFLVLFIVKHVIIYNTTKFYHKDLFKRIEKLYVTNLNGEKLKLGKDDKDFLLELEAEMISGSNLKINTTNHKELIIKSNHRDLFEKKLDTKSEKYGAIEILNLLKKTDDGYGKKKDVVFEWLEVDVCFSLIKERLERLKKINIS